MDNDAMLRNVRSNVTFALNKHTYVVPSVACVCFLRMINFVLISMFEDVKNTWGLSSCNAKARREFGCRETNFYAFNKICITDGPRELFRVVENDSEEKHYREDHEEANPRREETHGWRARDHLFRRSI